MRCSVVVPTYQRANDLERCLRALERQEKKPDEVLIVCRSTDVQTIEFLSTFSSTLPITVLHVERPGVVAALNIGLAHVSTDFVAITDDDAAPRSSWLARIEKHYESDAKIGGVGGRDYVDGLPESRGSQLVGRLRWYGRAVGQHHLGVGPARAVDFLKGVNMAFRCSAIDGMRFDERLLGAGAQVHNEMGFSLALRRRGWKIVYDPSVAVDHYPGVRFDGESRSREYGTAVRHSTFNETIAILEHLPKSRRVIFWIWAVFVGKRDAPGLLQCIRLGAFQPRMWQTLKTVLLARLDAQRVVESSSVA